jgi:probable HAF family extracellular repeat protein
MQDLGTLGGTVSYAQGINNSGQVVGYDQNNGADSAFLYSGGVMQDLHNLLAPGFTNWYISTANAINDSGQIVGTGGTVSGQTHAVLLTPIPEPTTLLLLTIGAISLLTFIRRKR